MCSFPEIIVQGVLIFWKDEAMLRKRIQELQGYRRLGLSTAADIEKYDADFIKRVSCYASIHIVMY